MKCANSLPELVERVDIVNIDRLASRVVGETGTARQRRTIDDDAALREWAAMLTEVGERRWDAEFLVAEWSDVILGQVLRSRSDYCRARRPGHRRIIIAGATAGLIPRAAIARYQDTDARRYQRERARDRSLLFVAATRARDDLAIFWHGQPSPFLANAQNTAAL
nr:hypothetical protein [Frankia sp. QA3]